MSDGIIITEENIPTSEVPDYMLGRCEKAESNVKKIQEKTEKKVEKKLRKAEEKYEKKQKKAEKKINKARKKW